MLVSESTTARVINVALISLPSRTCARGVISGTRAMRRSNRLDPRVATQSNMARETTPRPTVRIETRSPQPQDDLARREAFVALLFRLENSPDPEQIIVLVDAVLAWFTRHPGCKGTRSIFAELLGALVEPLAPGVRVPDELLEIRNMLATRVETWKRHWLQEGELKGRQEGGAALLLRQMESRFGALPGWARDRIAAADTAALEEWGLRLLDAGSLDDILA
jgi:hypothetical protein